MRNRFEEISIILLSIISVLISILDFLGLLEFLPWISDRINTITLLIIGLLTSYIIIFNTKKINRIDTTVSENAEKIITSLDGVQVNVVNP